MSELSNMLYFAPASYEHQVRERKKARDLKASVWWKNQKGRGICYHCKKRFSPSELTLDHLIPIVRGGVTNKKNCVPSCKECNTKRKYFLPSEMALAKLTSLD
jgi:5-methylcytosine-specific restriction protein A